MVSDLNIILHAVGFSGEGELVQKAGCCISLEFEDEYGRKSNRVITHPIGNASADRAHLQAAHLALASIIRPMRRMANVKLVCPAAVKAILDETDPEYSEVQKENNDVVGEARKWITFYDKLRFVPCSVQDLLGLDEAKACAESQKGSDTGTVVV